MGLLCVVAHGLKVVVVSDVHYNVFYRPDISELDYCAEEEHSVKAELYAPYGRLGCDPPHILFDRFIARFNETEKPDVVFLPGDLVGHGSVLSPRQPYSAHAYE